MQNIEITNMVMVNDKNTGRVAVIDRVKSWCGIAFPGGHAEDGESIYDSAIREIREETGLLISNLTSCGFMHWFNNRTGSRYFTYFYKTSDFTGELISGTDEGRVFWTELETLSEMKLAPHMSAYLKMFDGGLTEAYCSWNETDKQIIIYR